MRIFSAGLDCENNTFTNFLTGWRSFQEGGIWRGDAATGDSWLTPVPKTFARLSQERGFEYVEGLYAAAQPAGPMVREVYEALRDEILEGIRVRGPFDIVLLHLEGAMIAQGYDDCEGDILSRAKALLPPETVIGSLLDPHCHLTAQMVRNANFLVACKYFPHDDYAARALDLFDLCVRMAKRQIDPVPAVFDCKMIGIYPTTNEPMAGVVRALVAAERLPGILSVSFIHGFPYGDTVDTGSKMLVYADRDGLKAAECARHLGRQVYDLRHQLIPGYPGMQKALDDAVNSNGTVVLADMADNAGGGAPGDNVAVLAELLRRKIENAALASIWDPQAALLCAEAGVGTRLMVRLGGKTNACSGSPIDINATVRAICPDHWQTSLGDTRQPMGLSVWLEVNGIDVVICSVRSQVFAPDIFTGLGIDLRAKHIIVVKSVNHFFSRFAPIATRIVHMATAGAVTFDFANIDYKKRSKDYFPRLGDPLNLSSNVDL
jgi:microcystin degradation protein MlrC